MVSVAADIDPTYAAAPDAAQRAGVEVIAYRADITPTEQPWAQELRFVCDRQVLRRH